MGESNQAGSVEYQYYLWIRGAATSWYVTRIGGSTRFPDFESYRFKLGQWVLEEGGYGPEKRQFRCRHQPITKEEATKCIIGGPKYCLQMQ